MSASNTSPRTDSPTLKLNGEVVHSTASTLVELLSEQGIDPTKPGIAVALNDAVVPRASWPEQQVRVGDRVEVITAMQGG